MGPTQFLVRVAEPTEAQLAIEAGADRLGLTDARGPLSLEDVGAIVRAVAGRRPLAVAARLLDGGSELERAQSLAGSGVDAVELPAGPHAPILLRELRRAHPAARGVALFPAEREDLWNWMGPLAEAGFHAALLTPSKRPAPALAERPGISTLAAFVDAAQRRGLDAWIEGGLEPPDIPRLLVLRPDVLAFRAGLCANGDRAAPLDRRRVDMMRALIPRASSPPALARAPAPPLSPRRPDTVFVRDFVVEGGIGAYAREHRAPQRMRFNVEASVEPIPADVTDMRDVFSYDVMIDAIRLATRRHVLLVERVAHDVAAAILREPRVRRVRVRVEKLDVLDGGVGVEIERDAP